MGVLWREKRQLHKNPLSLSFYRAIDHSGFFRVKLIFTTLIRIFALNSKFRHRETRHAQSCLGWASQNVYMICRRNIFTLAKVALPRPENSLTRVVSPFGICSRSSCERLVEFSKDISEIFSRPGLHRRRVVSGTRPRQYKWSHSVTQPSLLEFRISKRAIDFE